MRHHTRMGSAEKKISAFFFFLFPRCPKNCYIFSKWPLYFDDGKYMQVVIFNEFHRKMTNGNIFNVAAFNRKEIGWCEERCVLDHPIAIWIYDSINNSFVCESEPHWFLMGVSNISAPSAYHSPCRGARSSIDYAVFQCEPWHYLLCHLPLNGNQSRRYILARAKENVKPKIFNIYAVQMVQPVNGNCMSSNACGTVHGSDQNRSTIDACKIIVLISNERNDWKCRSRRRRSRNENSNYAVKRF